MSDRDLPRAVPPSRFAGLIHRLALATCAATFVLILFGGLVTGLGVGLSVPDWPTTFGHNMFLFPPSGMVGGVFYEHTHRLLGSLVGLLTVALAAMLWLCEGRRRLTGLGVAALLLVVLQGVLGGLRVVWLHDGLALVHGIVAQGFFALVVGLAVGSSDAWRGAAAEPPRSAPEGVRRLALATAGVAYLQVAFGAVLTHTGSRLDAHLGVAVLLSGLLLTLCRRILARREEWPLLARAAGWLHAVWGGQLLLGAAAYLVRFHAAEIALPPEIGLAVRVAHRLTGALLLGAAVAVAAWSYRVGPAASPTPTRERQAERVAA